VTFSQSPVAYLLEYCYHQKNHCHFNSDQPIFSTVWCLLQFCYVNVSLCLFKCDLPGWKACISCRQKSDTIFNFSAIVFLMLLNLKMECYHFPLLPSYLTMTVRQEPGADCYFEKQIADVVKAFFFTDLCSSFLDSSCHKWGEAAGACRCLAHKCEQVCTCS